MYLQLNINHIIGVMAKIPDGVFSGFIGRLGNVVGVKRNGDYYLRIVSDTAKNPNTKKQRKQRGGFGTAARLTNKHKLGPFLRETYGFAGGNWNSRFISYNTSLMRGEGAEERKINFPGLLVSTGHLKPVDNATAERAEEGNIRFRWTDNSGDGNAGSHDSMVLLAIYEEDLTPVYQFDAGSRMDEQAILPLPARLQHEPVHVYICSRSPDGKFYSNSEYLGRL